MERLLIVMMMHVTLLSLLLLAAARTCSAQEESLLLWSDEFRDSGSVNPLIWSHDTGGGGWGNGEIQTYAENHVVVENGKLVIRVSSNYSEWNGRTFTSGRIRSNEKLEFQYGTVIAKIKVPDVGNGLWPALWMLGTTFPDLDWPMSGEIDIMELGSARALQLDMATTRLGSAVHWQASGRNQQKYNELDVDFDLSEDYHLYKLEWTPESITTYVNDIPIVQKNIANISCFECEELHQPFFFVLNLAVGGGYTRIYHEQGITADIPAELLVDYIRLYDNGFTKLSGSFVDTPPPSALPATAPPTSSPTKPPGEGDDKADDGDDEKPSSTEPPTLEPTALLPVSSPSPTASPTLIMDKSLRPTVVSPSTLPIQRLDAKSIQMALTNTEPLNPMSAQVWSEVTRDFLSAQVTSAIGLVENVTVDVSLVSQDPPFVLRARRRRSLEEEENESNQVIVFDALFQIQSVVDVHDVNRYIIGAFNTLEKKESYLMALQASDDAFSNADDVVVAPATSVSRVVQNPNNANDNNLGIGLTVGIVLAVLAIFCLVAAIVYSKRRKAYLKKKRKSRQEESKSSTSEHQESPTAKAYRGDDDSLYNIPVDTPSTCEESLYTSPSKGTLDYQFTCPRSSKQAASTVFTSDSDFAEYIASFKHKDPEPVLDDSESEFTAGSQTYDYSAAYKNMQGSIADSQSQMTGHVTQDDDDTIVAEYVVNAPSGNLGIILESSDDGVPVVQSVKESSPLADKVNIGDRLLSVDGRDVSMVLVTTVSRIIASKKNNPTRQFVFARPMEI